MSAIEELVVPAPSDLRNLFEACANEDATTKKLMQVYSSGVMYEKDKVKEPLLLSSIPLDEGLALWYMVRKLTPSVIVETGFGRGGSAAFLLSACSPWNGKVISIDPAFRHWANGVGETYLGDLGVANRHQLIEEPSEFALARLISKNEIKSLKFSFVDGSHHFDGTLFDFMYLDKVTEVGGVIGIDDASAPAVRTVTSFVAHNLPYRFYYPNPRLVLCQKMAPSDREWDHFKPFHSSKLTDWSFHTAPPTEDEVPKIIPSRG